MWLIIAYKRQKCQNKIKQKREKFKKPKELGRAFAKLALAKAQAKNGHQTIFAKKIHGMRKKMQQNPAINLQKWITKTAKKLTKRQNKTSSAAKSTASYLQKS